MRTAPTVVEELFFRVRELGWCKSITAATVVVYKAEEESSGTMAWLRLFAPSVWRRV
jgi:hypothetical protein